MLAEFSEELFIDDAAELPAGIRGIYLKRGCSKVILLSRRIETINEKLCVLVEEEGHYFTTVGDITDQSKVENRKQELKARRWAVRKLIPIEQFIEAFKSGITTKQELADFLNVTEKFLLMSIDHYKNIYGVCHKIGDYTIYFDPLMIFKNLDDEEDCIR